VSLADEVLAVRTAVGLHADPAAVVLEVTGPDALAAVERALPSDLYLRDGQCRQSLLLDVAGRPVADVLVARDDDRYLLTVAGATVAEALARFDGEGRFEARALVVSVVSAHGPWAWELVGEAFDPGAAAVPYLNLFRADGLVGLRAGRTGEFGYELLAPRAEADAVMARLAAAGARFGAVAVSTEALRHCAFEGWFFEPSLAPEGDDVTAVELQLLWRLSPTRPYAGREAIRARLRAPTQRRLTFVVTDELAAVGDRVSLDGEDVGVVTRAARSLTRGDAVAHALLDARVAHGGIAGLRVGAQGLSARTVAPPLVNNRSLHVDPRRHAFACADEVAFPPPARGGAPGCAP